MTNVQLVYMWKSDDEDGTPRDYGCTRCTKVFELTDESGDRIRVGAFGKQTETWYPTIHKGEVINDLDCL